MNRNNRIFEQVATVKVPRTRMQDTFSHLTTFNGGSLIPLGLWEVLPGDTFEFNSRFTVRMTTPVHPVMDDAFFDYYYFFVPNRLVWEHWKNFMGEVDVAPSPDWSNVPEYSVPRLLLGGRSAGVNGNVIPGSLINYLGVPIGNYTRSAAIAVNALPARAFAQVWNDYFRDENLQPTIPFNKGDEDDYLFDLSSAPGTYPNVISGESGGQFDYSSDFAGLQCPPVNKLHDYFTSALPYAQKGDAPILNVLGEGFIPLTTASATVDFGSTAPAPKFTSFGKVISQGSSHLLTLHGTAAGSTFGFVDSSPSSSTQYVITGSNLGIDSADWNVGFTINQLRLTIATQQFLETLARSGSRYIEIIRSMFGVQSSDSRLQRAEYIYGYRQVINMAQIAQTSETTDNSPLGSLAAFSLTNVNQRRCVYSSEEHGFIICVGCVRTKHKYAYGLHRMFSRWDRLDYYWPLFANIGNQPIYKREIFLNDNTDQGNDDVFGYKEAWAEYRYQEHRVSGMFSPQYSSSLKSWTYVDEYAEAPTLVDSWIREPTSQIDQTLQVSSESTHQFLCDCQIDVVTTRCMPLFSEPGLTRI